MPHMPPPALAGAASFFGLSANYRLGGDEERGNKRRILE
jgi:hypothetical protein